MYTALLVVSLLGADRGAPSLVRVYRFVDGHGQEHYVDSPDEVPAGTAAEPVDLTDVPLNPETAKALSEAAKRATKPQAAPTKGDARPPADARTFLVWSGALTFAFLGLVFLTRLLKRRLPALAFALGIVRFAAGSLALMSWAATAYEYRDSRHWLTEHFPPFQALDRALKAKEQVDRQQKKMEYDIDHGLRGD